MLSPLLVFLESLFFPLFFDGWQKIRSVLCLIMLSLVLGEPFQPFYLKNASLFSILSLSLILSHFIFQILSFFLPVKVDWKHMGIGLPGHASTQDPRCHSGQTAKHYQLSLKLCFLLCVFKRPRSTWIWFFWLFSSCNTWNEFDVRISYRYETHDAVSRCLTHRYIFRNLNR